jgi:hypothetical protein
LTKIYSGVYTSSNRIVSADLLTVILIVYSWFQAKKVMPIEMAKLALRRAGPLSGKYRAA